MRYSDDELDRALLELPLEEPPPGLRASILAATVYKPDSALKLWEVYVVGALLALIAWFAAVIFANGVDNFVRTLLAFSSSLSAGLSNSGALLWISLGSSATIWIYILSLMPWHEAGRLQRQ